MNKKKDNKTIIKNYIIICVLSIISTIILLRFLDFYQSKLCLGEYKDTYIFGGAIQEACNINYNYMNSYEIFDLILNTVYILDIFLIIKCFSMIVFTIKNNLSKKIKISIILLSILTILYNPIIAYIINGMQGLIYKDEIYSNAIIK